MTVDRIGLALLHALWQGGLVAAGLAAALLLTRRTRPALRYALSATALALMLVLPIAAAVAPFPATRGVTGTPGPVEDGSSGPIRAPSAAPPAGSVAAAIAAPVAQGVAALPARSVAVGRRAALLRWSEAASRSVAPAVRAALPWLVVVWLGGVLLFAARLAGGLLGARRMVQRGTRAVPPAVAAASAHVATRLGVRARVRVLESECVAAPVLVGALRPTILLPASALRDLDSAALDMLLAHELAHVRRRDVLANLAQTVAEALLFFHPAAWWVSGRIREEREHCCDDEALAASGGDVVGYAEVLLSLAEARAGAAAFAAASNGGALLRRVARLVRRVPAPVDLGPRWATGVLATAFVLVSARDAVGVSPGPRALRRADLVGESALQPRRGTSGPTGRVAQDSARWRPAAVVTLRDQGGLAERWRAAEQHARSRGLRSLWVGWVVPGVGSADRWFYMDRETAIRASGNDITGRIHFDRRPSSDVRFPGVALAPLVGRHAPEATAVLLRLDGPAGSRRLTNVHVARFELPMHFRALPLVWLDAAGGEESVALLRRLALAERSEPNRDDLVAAIGMHVGAPAAVETLIAWLEDGSLGAPMRREAAGWLGKHPDRRAFLALARAARRADDRGVRVEAVESIGELPFEEAADSLMLYARQLPEAAGRHEAIETLGERTELRVVAFLHRLVDDPGDADVSSRAVEALGQMEGGIGLDAVTDAARHHRDPRVRRAAVEALAQIEAPGHVLDVLRDVVWTDADASVRAEAIESIADVGDARALDVLRDVVERHDDAGAQREATETIASAVAPDAAIPLLGRIARSHPRAEVRREAAEALGDFDDARAVELLAALAESHPEADVQMEAVEALGDVQPRAPALAALRRIARTHPSRAVRREAADALADYAESGRR